jgi:hypothetical protein
MDSEIVCINYYAFVCCIITTRALSQSLRLGHFLAAAISIVSARATSAILLIVGIRRGTSKNERTSFCIGGESCSFDCPRLGKMELNDILLYSAGLDICHRHKFRICFRFAAQLPAGIARAIQGLLSIPQL